MDLVEFKCHVLGPRWITIIVGAREEMRGDIDASERSSEGPQSTSNGGVS